MACCPYSIVRHLRCWCNFRRRRSLTFACLRVAHTLSSRFTVSSASCTYCGLVKKATLSQTPDYVPRSSSTRETSLTSTIATYQEYLSHNSHKRHIIKKAIYKRSIVKDITYKWVIRRTHLQESHLTTGVLSRMTSIDNRSSLRKPPISGAQSKTPFTN